VKRPSVKRHTTIYGLKFRGNTFWAAVQYFFWVTAISIALLALLEYQWHAISAPAGKFLKGLPYATVMTYFLYVACGIVSLVKRRLPAFGVFLSFLANMAIFYMYKDLYPFVNEKETLSLFESISFWLIEFVILLYAIFKIGKLKINNSGDSINSTMFRLHGTPGVMYFSYFFRSLIIPYIAACVVDMGNLSVNSVWQAIFYIYGFLWVYENIRIMLLCNMRRRRRSKMSQFWHTQHLILFLPELALFLIWYFDWLPMPKWVSGTLIVYGFFWLLSSISMLTMKTR
jgi:hypothetical protein